MKKTLIFLILMLMLLNSIGEVAEVTTSHLEPLPLSEVSPDYGGHSIEFVYY